MYNLIYFTQKKSALMEVTHLLFSLFISFLLLLVAVGYFYLVAKPKKIRQIYIREFRKKGLRVYELPHEYFSYPLVKILNEDGEKGDAFTTMKNISMNHDVIISNAFNLV